MSPGTSGVGKRPHGTILFEPLLDEAVQKRARLGTNVCTSTQTGLAVVQERLDVAEPRVFQEFQLPAQCKDPESSPGSPKSIADLSTCDEWSRDSVESTWSTSSLCPSPLVMPAAAVPGQPWPQDMDGCALSNWQSKPTFFPLVKSGSSQQSDAQSRQLKIAGPEKIQTLRGQLLGREVALVFCGEAHEDAIDLTRSRSKVQADEGWVELPCNSAHSPGLDSADAFATKERLTLEGAKKWASKALRARGDATGGTLVFDSKRPGYAKARGVARVFPPGTKRSSEYEMPFGASVFEWGDLDQQARMFNQRRANVKTQMSAEEQDALIEERKQACLAEGIELFDDWLIRQASSKNQHVHLLLEGPIAADEVELHVEENVDPAPVADKHICEIEPDSDEDSDAAESLGNGSYLDTIRRRVAKDMPRERVHCIDPRLLGDADDDNLPKALQGSFKALAASSPPTSKDLEEVELENIRERSCDCKTDAEAPLPSWEAFFGTAADLLYYAPHIKADYTPFLTNCVGSAEKLKKFFRSLFFGTVQEALAEIHLDKGTRPSAAIRSSLLQAKAPSADVACRPKGICRSGRTTIPVKAAPVDRYLKARGSNPPRTWLSGLVQRLENAGAEDLVAAAQDWYLRIVSKVLDNPKGADHEGDNFGAWLRAAHRNIFDDIDRYDLAKLQRATWAYSQKNPKSRDHRYNLKDIKIPGLAEAFDEFRRSRALSQPSSSREQCLSQIIVDSFSLRSVDLSMVLKIADVAASTPKGIPVVIVVYAGLDHTRSVAKFWSSQGFSNDDLPNKGLVGKENWSDDEARCLKLPSYLHDFDKLFPIRPRIQKTKRTGAQGKKVLQTKIKTGTQKQRARARFF